MQEAERVYVHTLTFERALDYIGHRWGVKLTVSLDVVRQPNGKAVLVAAVGLLDALHRSELNDPPTVVLTTRLKRDTSVDRFLREALIVWDKSVLDHNNADTAQPA